MAWPLFLERDLESSEVARIADVTEWTVRKWIREGKLAAYNISSDGHPRYRVTQAALEVFLRTYLGREIT